MTTGSLQIHSENILPIIKKWLYSDKDIFVRELVSNACDASHKLKVLRERGETKAADDTLRVELKIDKEARTLTVSDYGVGMDAEEVEKYICQLAFSGAEEFMEKYKSDNKEDQIIGHFGLGFYSAYMVAKSVEIHTLSYKEGAKAVRWSCDGGSDYDIEEGTRTTRGTDIILHLDDDSDEFLEAERLAGILKEYCTFLPYPIYLDDRHINHKEPLWMQTPSNCTDKDYLEFYRHLYPNTQDPLLWVHLNVDYPFRLQGILYFPRVEKQVDLRDHRVKLFCNRVFVSDTCKDLLPEYLSILRGALDSPDIPLNVSRSYLQMDRTVRQLAKHISKKVSDSLSALHRDDRERFIDAWKDIGVIIKLGAVEDEKFYERVKGLLLWKTATGEWITVEDYIEKNKETTADKVYYTTHEKHAEHVLEAYKDRGIDVLIADAGIDTYLINFLEKKLSDTIFQRIDADISEALVDSSREKTVLDADGKTEAGRLADFFRRKLSADNIEVEAKSLARDELPAVITMHEQRRRLRDYMRAMDPDQPMAMDAHLDHYTLVVNTNSPLMHAIQKLDTQDPELAGDLAHEICELTLLSQRELDPNALNTFIARSQRVLSALASKATGSETS